MQLALKWQLSVLIGGSEAKLCIWFVCVSPAPCISPRRELSLTSDGLATFSFSPSVTSRPHGRVSPHFENHCPSRPKYVAAYNQSGCYETDISSSLFPRAQLGSSTCPPPTHYIMFHSEINLGPFAHTQFGQRLPQIRCPDLKYVMHLVCEKDTEIPGMVLCNQCLTITRVTVVNGLILTRERSFMFLPVLNITQWLAISCWGGWLLTLFGHSSCGVGDDFLPFCCHRAALVAHCHIGV